MERPKSFSCVTLLKVCILTVKSEFHLLAAALNASLQISRTTQSCILIYGGELAGVTRPGGAIGVMFVQTRSVLLGRCGARPACARCGRHGSRAPPSEGRDGGCGS